MSDNQWTAVDRYMNESLVLSDPVLDSVVAQNAAAGLPPIDVTPTQGKFLHLIAKIHGSRRILEIGTLGGYSTIWLARALPAGGRLVTLEADPKHAAVARSNIAKAGLSEIVDLRLGLALDTLPQLEQEKIEPFDLIFIDADKSNNPEYLKWALKFSRRGSLIIVDNVVRSGAVIDEKSPDPNIQGIRRLFQMLVSEPRLSATALQTVGAKGYDGFVMALVVSD
jgi:predicted O-methyltransferase YrrM